MLIQVRTIIVDGLIDELKKFVSLPMQLNEIIAIARLIRDLESFHANSVPYIKSQQFVYESLGRLEEYNQIIEGFYNSYYGFPQHEVIKISGKYEYDLPIFKGVLTFE